MSAITATVDQTHAAIDVTVTSTVVLDTASRTVVSGWGTADSGQTYTVSPFPGNFAANGSALTMLLNTVNVKRVAALGVSLSDIDVIVGNVTVSTLPTGGNVDVAVEARYVDSSNFVDVRLFATTANTITLAIRQLVLGVETLLGFFTVIGATATTTLSVRLQAIGNVLRAKAWLNSVAEPTGWTASMTTTMLSAGDIRFTGLLEVGNSNGSETITWDNISAPGDNAVYLYRITPDGASTLVRGSPVVTSNRVALFWDDEAPLNTAVTYTAVTTMVTLQTSSLTITGSGGDIGWLKDPVVPANDVPLNLALRSVSDCVGATGVGFTDMDTETFTDADGEFAVVNAARPDIVAMTRKAATTTLSFVSAALSDAVLVETLLASGRILLVQLPLAYGWAYSHYGSDYVHVGDVAKGRLTTQNKKHPHRIWSLPVALSNAPANTPTNMVGSNGVGVGRATFGTMKASGLTNLQLKNTNDTYLQLAQGLGY
jgi:hypothetical protein